MEKDQIQDGIRSDTGWNRIRYRMEQDQIQDEIRADTGWNGITYRMEQDQIQNGVGLDTKLSRIILDLVGFGQYRITTNKTRFGVKK